MYLGELMAKKHDSVQLDRQELNLLILAAREGDDGAFSTLHSAYKGLLVSVVNSFSGKIPSDVYSPEDLMQECLMAFYRAVERYDVENTKVTFGLFAKTCMQNAMISLLRKALTVKRRQTKNSLRHEADGPKDVLDSIVSSCSGEDMRAKACDHIDRLLLAKGKKLSALERFVLGCFIGGMTYAEIADELGIPEKSVDNALYRIRRKLDSGSDNK